MIKFQDLRQGDYLLANFDDKIEQVEVTRLNRDEKQICVDNGVQEFWFDAEALSPLPLDEKQLLKLSFEKQQNEDGSVKYLKGAFRILTASEGAFNDFEIWYRDEKRHIIHPIAVHQLQNHFLEMTKVHLNNESM